MLLSNQFHFCAEHGGDLSFKVTHHLQKKRRGTAGILLLVLLILSVDLLAVAQPAPSNTSEQAPVNSAKLQLPQTELLNRWVECTKKSIELSQSFSQHIQMLLACADGYDVEAYRKADDELSSIYEQQDATYLESGMIAEALSTSESDRLNAVQLIKTTAFGIKQSKMFTYKSSAIFYLCFGRPVQASHCARLALSIAEAPPATEADKLPPLLFYAGAASFWCGDYQPAVTQLKRSLELDKDQPYAAYYLGDAYIAQNQATNAISCLVSARQTAKSDEQKGVLDKALAVAYTLNKQTDLAKRCIENAKQELTSNSPGEFPSVAKESLGIVTALAGDYRAADRILSEAITGLQQSPIKLGNRLEAAQASLWRSCVRRRSGNLIGADEDRKYALSFADEASHLLTLSRVLDKIFGFKETLQITDSIPDRWAIVVGIDTFADPSVPKLRYPSKDARDIEQFLLNDARFKPNHVKLLLNNQATRAAIVENLAGSWLPNVVRPGDLVFLFISSHGTPAYKDIGALNSVVTYDTMLEHLFSTSLPMQNIVRLLRAKLKKQHVFVVLDTCYAGGLAAPGEAAQSAANVDPDLLIISRRQLLVGSSDKDERSWESKRYKNSVFTRQLVDALKTNPAYDDFHALFSQIVDRVNQEVSADFKHTQTPRLAGSWHGKGLITPPIEKSLSAQGAVK